MREKGRPLRVSNAAVHAFEFLPSQSVAASLLLPSDHQLQHTEQPEQHQAHQPTVLNEQHPGELGKKRRSVRTRIDSDDAESDEAAQLMQPEGSDEQSITTAKRLHRSERAKWPPEGSIHLAIHQQPVR